jgi:pyruvyltransferase
MFVTELVRRLERRCVFWWEPKDGAPNVGDYLARVLVAQVLQRADRQILDKRDRRRRLFAIGSVLHFARDGDTVWGSGVNGKVDPAAHRFARLDVRAVRGPLTRAFLLARGIACPPVYGDPALLAPRLWPAQWVADERGTLDFVVVPHLNDSPARYSGFGERVCSPRQYPAAFIRRLLRAQRVVSASLHGVILAEAYGLPAVLLDSGGSETRLKFDDYYQGTGRHDYPVAASVGAALALPAAPPPAAALEAAATRLLRAFPWDLWVAPPGAAVPGGATPDDASARSARA